MRANTSSWQNTSGNSFYLGKSFLSNRRIILTFGRGQVRGYTEEELKAATAILPSILTLAGRSIKLAQFLRKHPMEPNLHHEEVRDLGEKYAFEVLGPPGSQSTYSPNSSLPTTSIPHSVEDSSPGSTPRVLTPPAERQNRTAEHRESDSPGLISLQDSSLESLLLPPNILDQVSPLTSQSNLLESPPQTTISSNPPEDQHDGHLHGTTCKESICCIVT